MKEKEKLGIIGTKCIDALAKLLIKEPVFNWLKKRGEKHPYFHITNVDGSEVYMYRYWIFNPYSRTYNKFLSWLPSIRLHKIMRPDFDIHLHDHPWDARTFILDGWYEELKEKNNVYYRLPGHTHRLNYGEYHKISRVSRGGVWTLFITFKYKGTWGFKVNGEKIPHHIYLKEKGYN